MNGARSLLDTLLASSSIPASRIPYHGVPSVAALDIARHALRAGLHENDPRHRHGGRRLAHRRQARVHAVHCGPGLANGLTQPAQRPRARSGIVTSSATSDLPPSPHPPLTADTEALARTVSRGCARARTRKRSGATPPGRARRSHGAGADRHAHPPRTRHGRGRHRGRSPARSRSRRRSSRQPWMKRPRAAREWHDRLCSSSEAAAALAEPRARWSVGMLWARPSWRVRRARRARSRAPSRERVPTTPTWRIEALARFEHLILVNARPPVAFFAYPGKPRPTTRPARSCTCSRARTRSRRSAARSPTRSRLPRCDSRSRPTPAIVRGAPDTEGLAQTSRRDARGWIVSDESVSYGRTSIDRPTGRPRTTGCTLRAARSATSARGPGAAIASSRNRRVLSLQADGSAMLLAAVPVDPGARGPAVHDGPAHNRKYAILLGEYKRGRKAGRHALSMRRPGRPAIDWVNWPTGWAWSPRALPRRRSAPTDGGQLSPGRTVSVELIIGRLECSRAPNTARENKLRIKLALATP